jgi:hypothetical protein
MIENPEPTGRRGPRTFFDGVLKAAPSNQ